jgi:PAS domain S-box-containing protein
MTRSTVKFSNTNAIDIIKAQPVRVLHVDDDAGFLKTARAILEMQGAFQVETASCVEEAWEKMKKEEYDAVVSDYQMPGKDGLQFLKELREKGNSIPFVIFTGKGREEVAIKALNFGADGYFNKTGYPETVYGELAHGIRETVERRRVSEALDESESKSRTLLENLPQKVFFKDKDSVYISCNENYARDLKIKSDEIIGRTDYDFYPKELAEKYRADDKRIMKSGNTEDIEEEYVQDGQKVFVQTVKTPVKDEKGNVVGILGIFWDITERKKAEEALEQRHHSLATLNTVSIELASLPFDTDIREFLAKRLREITGAVAVAFADYDAGNKTLVARLAEFEPGMQEEFTRLLGKSLGEIRCPVSEKDYREITKSVIGKRQKLTEATYGGIPLSVAAEVQKLLGVDRFIGIAYIIKGELYGTSLLAIKVGMPDPPPEMLESFGHIAAVSLRHRRAEARALENEERYRELAESISDVFFAFDKDLRYTYWNRASEKLTGIKAKDAIGKSLIEVFPDAKGTEIEQVYQNVVKTKKHQTISTEYQLRGKTSIFELNAYPTRNGLSVFVKDITERKKTSERSRVLNEKLGVVGKLNRHDVRNKLSAVVNNTYLAKKTLPNDHKALAYLKEIESACIATTRILDFAAAYENLGVEELTLVDVDKTVEEAVSLVSELKGVKVVNNSQGLTVMADSAISQLFFNLIENSLKHGKNVSQIKIHYEEGKDRVKLFYEDNGVGIPKANKSKLFNWGFTTGTGSGYGLPLIKNMMEIYGWTIEEEGEPGKGARFVITIPKTHTTMRA